MHIIIIVDDVVSLEYAREYFKRFCIKEDWYLLEPLWRRQKRVGQQVVREVTFDYLSLAEFDRLQSSSPDNDWGKYDGVMASMCGSDSVVQPIFDRIDQTFPEQTPRCFATYQTGWRWPRGWSFELDSLIENALIRLRACRNRSRKSEGEKS